jgi:hypothetical protein
MFKVHAFSNIDQLLEEANEYGTYHQFLKITSFMCYFLIVEFIYRLRHIYELIIILTLTEVQNW